MKNIFLIIGILSACVSCQTAGDTVKGYEDIPLGATKGDVVTSIGGPNYTYRKNSVDHWVYKLPNSAGRVIERELWFEKGVVVKKVTPGNPQPSDFVPID